MYKITINDLQIIKKALKSSINTIKNANTEYKKRKAVAKNQKAIELIDDGYLNRKSN